MKMSKKIIENPPFKSVTRHSSEFIQFEKPFNVLTKIDGTNEPLNVPIKLWMSEIERGALDQLYNVARLPFVFHHVGEMPDGHVGYGVAIGCVLATYSDYIIPNAVGVDIGCGVCSIRTNMTHLNKYTREKIRDDIFKLIPVGKNHNKSPQPGMPEWTQGTLVGKIIDEQYDSARNQLGTLGGGNHFIELQMGSDGYIYIMLHSGSRNLGKRVADHYNKLAKENNEKWFSSVPSQWDLAFLHVHENSGRHYTHEMEYCVRFAAANRLLMLKRVEEAISNHVPDFVSYVGDFTDIAHNYARLEHHYGKNVWVHRKGATPAYKDQLGLIPGSQGTNSYIVRGLGNKESFMSCSHGAGREMGRKRACSELDLEKEVKKLNDIGVVHSIKHTKDLEEAAGAYKNIHEVIVHQIDLVEPVVELRPLLVVKG
jgi:tRNA-splicing ligase RtcB